MKKIITLAIALVLGVLFITGCTKKRTGSSSSSSSSGSSSSSSGFAMKATVGSTSFNVDNCYAITVAGSQIAITGNSGTGTNPTPPILTITIQNYAGPGTYTVPGTTTSLVAIGWEPTSVVTDGKGASSGTITVTSSSSSAVVGTFSGTLTDGTTVSGGTFTARKL